MKKFGLILLAAFALLFVAVNPASAHTPAVSATCSALTIDLTNYNGENSVTIIIDDVTIVDGITFGSSFQGVEPFNDQYVAHTYKVKVRAHDDPNGEHGWSKNFTGTSTPCVKEPEPTPTETVPVPTPTETTPVPIPTPTETTPVVVVPPPAAPTPPVVTQIHTVAAPELAATGADWQYGVLAVLSVGLGMALYFAARKARSRR